MEVKDKSLDAGEAALKKGCHAAGEATGKAARAVTGKPVRAGLEFGARAAYEVSKDVGRIVGEDVIVTLGPSFSKVPLGASIAIDKLYKSKTVCEGLHHTYKDLAQDLALRIQQQMQSVYGAGKGTHGHR